jgi:hypothetical protein
MANRATSTNHTPWIVIGVLIVVILAGFLWMNGRKQSTHTVDSSLGAAPSLNNGTTTDDITALEASAVNIAIPSFEKAL